MNKSDKNKTKSKLPKKKQNQKNIKPEKKIKKTKNRLSINEKNKIEKKLLHKSRRRVLMLFLIFVFFLLITVLFSLKLEITKTRNGNNLEEMHEKQEESQTIVESSRGTIETADGVELAVDLKVYDIYGILDPNYTLIGGDPGYVQDPEYTAKILCDILGYDGETYDYFVEQLSKDPNEQKQVYFGIYGHNISLEQKIQIEESGVVGIGFEEETLRYYPYGDFASYIVGYAGENDDNEVIGKNGIEYTANGYLTGTDGMIMMSVDQYGVPIEGGVVEEIPAQDGSDIVLTIDSVIQTYIQQSMDEYLKGYTADLILTIVTDVHTGEILGAYALPSFNPNLRNIELFENPFTSRCYEPGSTFKTMTVTGAMENGTYDGSNIVQTGSRTESDWDNYIINDWNNGVGWGELTWDEGYYMSSNTVMTHIYDSMSEDYWKDYVTQTMKFNQPIENEFYTTPSCDFSPEYPIEYYTSVFGQGITVNPLQMVQAYSAVGNDGLMSQPMIVKGYKNPETGEMIESYDPIQSQVMSADTAQYTQGLMRGVVDYRENDQGSGRYYENEKYPVGTKTGQAEIASAGGYGDEYIYSTMTLAPIEDPEISVYTLAISPSDKTITSKAFPKYVLEIINNTLDYMYANNSEEVEVANETIEIENYISQEMESVTSSLTENNIKYLKIGDGIVDKQYPGKGQHVSNNQTIILLGTDNIDMPDLVGQNYQIVNKTCDLIGVECEISGVGVVSEVVYEDNKYKITLN